MVKIDHAKALKALKEAKTAGEMITSWSWLTATTKEEVMEQGKENKEYYDVWIKKAPHMVKQYMHDPYVHLAERGILDPKTRELVAIALLASLEEGDGLAWHIAVAMGQGATEEEILEVIYYAAYQPAKNKLGVLGASIASGLEEGTKLQKKIGN